MATWIITCPTCGTANEAPKEAIFVECGTISCTCRCTNCGGEFDTEEAYWRWLGLDSGPQDKPTRAKA